MKDCIHNVVPGAGSLVRVSYTVQGLRYQLTAGGVDVMSYGYDASQRLSSLELVLIL